MKWTALVLSALLPLSYGKWVAERELLFQHMVDTDNSVVKCSSETLWEIMVDVPNWNQWDPDLAEAALDNPNVPTTELEGATGTLKMKFGKTFNFQLHDVRSQENIAYITPMTGAELDWYWEINHCGDQLLVKEGVSCDGGLCFLYKWLIKQKSEEAFEKALTNLNNLCLEKEAAKKKADKKNDEI